LDVKLLVSRTLFERAPSRLPTVITRLDFYVFTTTFTMAQPPNFNEAYKRFQKIARTAGSSGGGPGGSPKGLAGGAASLLLLGGAILVGQNALFNVDGGHRAIKYTRIGGVKQEIYTEGERQQIRSGHHNSF
jgi:hypothetical protein